MICPRCSVAEISAETNQCVLCGYAPGGAVGLQVRPGVEFDERARRELEQQFRIERLLRAGPRSLVFLARELETERKVAVKVIPRAPVREAGLEDRFTRDAAAAASLDHPHIVPIYRFGSTTHLLWYSMKYIEGRSLADILRDNGPMDLQACLRIVEQIASALQYAHRRGITHGSIRPANVLVDAQEWALVTDFAVGRLLQRIPVAATEDAAPPGIEYVAPEESYARQPGPGADQFALAVLVYESLAGQPPARPPQPLVALRPETPIPLSDALLRAMNLQPTGRFMSVLEFVSVLGTNDHPTGGLVPMPRRSPRPSSSQRVLFVDGPSRSRRWLGITAGIAVVFVAALALFEMLPDAAAPPPRVVEQPTAPPRVTPAPPPASPTPAATRADPRVTPPTTDPRPAARPAPPPARVVVAPGRLFINSIPWGQLSIDGQLVGNTPMVGLEITPGTRRLRVTRDGFRPFELEIQVAPGQEVRLTNIQLQEATP
jgi:eukaryotic-like serine/threonine-protein kinase